MTASKPAYTLVLSVPRKAPRILGTTTTKAKALAGLKAVPAVLGKEGAQVYVESPAGEIIGTVEWHGIFGWRPSGWDAKSGKVR